MENHIVGFPRLPTSLLSKYRFWPIFRLLKPSLPEGISCCTILDGEEKMTESKPIWWEWVDLNNPSDQPIKLKDNAPEEMKKKFKEWQEKRAKYDKGWGNPNLKGRSMTEEELQELIERVNKEIP
jgi:hypothetical protein